MKKESDIEKILRLLADMEDFHPGDDYISEQIKAEDEAELSEEELDFIAAAGGVKKLPTDPEKESENPHRK